MPQRPEDFHDYEDLSTHRAQQQARYSPDELLKRLSPQDRRIVDELARRRGVSSEEELIRLIQIDLTMRRLGVEAVDESQIKPGDKIFEITPEKPFLVEKSFEIPNSEEE